MTNWGNCRKTLRHTIGPPRGSAGESLMHVKSCHNGGNNVEHIRVTAPGEDSTHDAEHDGRIEPARGPEGDPGGHAPDTDSVHIELTSSSDGRERNPEHNCHVDKCRGASSHVVIINARSDGGNAGTSAQQDDRCRVTTTGGTRCSARQAYQVEQWPRSDRTGKNIEQPEDPTRDKCAASPAMGSRVSIAGSTIAINWQRARTVRLDEDSSHEFLQPIAEDVAGDLEVYGERQ